jgi:hypothetical protein
VFFFSISHAEFSTQKNGCWDVAVFKVICKIKPTDKGWITFDTPIHHTQGELKSTFDDLKNGRVSKIAKSSSPDSAFIDLFPMRGSAKVPEVEQTMRLISYQGICHNNAHFLWILNLVVNYIFLMHYRPFLLSYIFQVCQGVHREL